MLLLPCKDTTTSDLKQLVSVDEYRSLQELVESGDKTRHVEIEVPSLACLAL